MTTFTPFPYYISDRLGSNWYVARRPLKKYADRHHVTPKRYQAIRADYKRIFDFEPYSETYMRFAKCWSK